jgi:maltose alpha-D-glucosyltransferase/alpha-amylase
VSVLEGKGKVASETAQVLLAGAGQGNLSNDPLWYKKAIIYQAHVRAFQDSNGDGVGDFPGLTQKLDYLQELGITAIWLLPFYPSPLRDDGYDIADYYTINPLYGTLEDFKEFLHEAHRRGLRVITELVINHTSDEHPWFQRARKAPPGSPLRDYYVWSDTPEKYKGVRIIFKDYEPSNWTWDHQAKAFYWHRFYSHQPDLNFENPVVHEEIIRILDFWLDLGVDGFRLDAIPYLYEQEGTSCDNLPETHAFLKKLRAHVDSKYGDRMLLAEANQWPEDAVTFFGQNRGDECHMAFHFPLMPRMFMAVRMEDSTPILDIIEQTPALPQTAQWALFLRNHDELTLEMVTDEERDYMYHAYASDQKARINLGIRRRLAPLLDNDRRKIELLQTLLFTLPGTPVLYYGDEIGMGDNIYLGDRNGVRTPMQWSSDRNAGFSRANPQSLFLPIIVDPEYHYEAINVEAQARNPTSLLSWTRRLLKARRRWSSLGECPIEFLKPLNQKVLAFLRCVEGETMLVVANLSRFPQSVELDLSRFIGAAPVEVFGGSEFPRIENKPYVLTLGSYAVFWFYLDYPAQSNHLARRSPEIPELLVQEDWREWVERRPELFVDLLEKHLESSSSFLGGIEVRSVRFLHGARWSSGGLEFYVAVLQIEQLNGNHSTIFLPLQEQSLDAHSASGAGIPLARVRPKNSVLTAAYLPEFAQMLAGFIGGNQVGLSLPAGVQRTIYASAENLKVVGIRDRSGNSHAASEITFAFELGHELRIRKRLQPGMNSVNELLRFLHDRGYHRTNQLVGYLSWQMPRSEASVVATLLKYPENTTTAWDYALTQLHNLMEEVAATTTGRRVDARTKPLVSLDAANLPARIGHTMAELHALLASEPNAPEFAPEQFTPFLQRSIYQGMRNQVRSALGRLSQQLSRLPDHTSNAAKAFLQMERNIFEALAGFISAPSEVSRIRVIGNLDLSHVLLSGNDLYLEIAEEQSQISTHNRIKRSCLRDVSSMLLSIFEAAQVVQLEQSVPGTDPLKIGVLQPSLQDWVEKTCSSFFRAYQQKLPQKHLIPDTVEHLHMHLRAFLIDRALHQLEEVCHEESPRLLQEIEAAAFALNVDLNKIL